MSTQTIIVLSIVIFGCTVPFSMIGQGGGAAYVPVMLISGMAIFDASTYSLLLIMITSTTATLVFSRDLTLDWKILSAISPLGLAGAFAGGYVAKWISSLVLTIVFALMLLLAAFLMMRPAKEGQSALVPQWLCWERNYSGRRYIIAMGMLIPAAALAGFCAGLLGVGAGLFLLSMLVLLFGCPMRVSIGLSVVYVGITALPSFVARLMTGNSFEARIAVPLSVAALCGAIVGPVLSNRVQVKHLRLILTCILAIFAVWIIVRLVL
jgi:uncharacterized protein